MEEKKLEKTSEEQLKGLTPQEQKEYREIIYKYDLDKIYNFNLGGFYLRGEINTPTQILNDLIKLPKKYEKEDNDTIYVKSKNEVLHFGYLEFLIELKFDMPHKGLVTVYLILKEPVKKAGGLFIDYQNNTIDHMILPNDNNLYTKIAVEYNIGGVLGGRSRIETDYEPLSVLRAKRYLYVLAGHVVFATCSENKKFLEARINLLAASSIGRKILQEFNRLSEHIPTNLGYEHIVYAQNQLLTNIIKHFEELFSKNKGLFVNLTVLSAQYRNSINEITDEISHHITPENYEEFSNIPTTPVEEQVKINIDQIESQEELLM